MLGCRDEGGLKDLLDEYKTEAGLSVHWIKVGPSGHELRPPAGGVLSHYDRCIPEADAVVKTIANSYYVQGMTIHAHNFLFRRVALELHVDTMHGGRSMCVRLCAQGKGIGLSVPTIQVAGCSRYRVR
jgi:hypothetical protein